MTADAPVTEIQMPSSSGAARVGALDGMRMIEIGSGVATAFCTKLLADLGAHVVKVERDDGDLPLRATPRDAIQFHYLNTSKQRRRLGESTPPLDEIFAAADAIVTDGDPVVSTIDLPPGIIVCTITPFGLTGPYSAYQSTAMNMFHSNAESCAVPTPPGDWPPLQVGGGIAEYDAGMNAAGALVAAYINMLRGGAARHIDISVHDCLTSMNRIILSRYRFDQTVFGGDQFPNSPVTWTCSDGHIVALGGTDKQFLALSRTRGGNAFADEAFLKTGPLERSVAMAPRMRSWCALRTRAEALLALQECGIPSGAVNGPEDLLQSPQLEARAFFQSVETPEFGTVKMPGPPYKLSRTPARSLPASRVEQQTTEQTTPLGTTRRPSSQRRGPLLGGLRVLDFTWWAAGPYATWLLAELGAEVIKVESRARPDAARRGLFVPSPATRLPGPFPFGSIERSPSFNDLNMNKRSLTLDLTKPEAVETVRTLLASCHVVTDNFRPGVMDRLGLGPQSLLAINPSLVVASASSYGAVGPDRSGAGNAMVFSAAGGLNDITGFPDGPPTQLGEMSDFRAGTGFALAILAAVAHRERTGEGQYVDLSSVETAIACAPDGILALQAGVPVVKRIGNHHLTMSPHNVYPATDGWVSIAVRNDSEWQALCEAMAAPDLVRAHDGALSRKANEAAIDSAISRWTSKQRRWEVTEQLQRRGVAAMPTMTNKDVVLDPHLAARGMFVDVDHPEMGTQQVPRCPWVFSPDGHVEPGPGPLLGEANGYVLGELLHMDQSKQARLARDLVTW